MPEQIRYCDKCGKLVTPGRVSHALIAGDVTICEFCKGGLSEEEKQRLGLDVPRRQTPALGTDTRATRRVSSTRSAVQNEGGNLKTVVVVAGLAAGLLVGVTLTLVLSGSDESPSVGAVTPSSPAVPPVPSSGPVDPSGAPEASSAAAPAKAASSKTSAAAKALDDIRSLRDPRMTRYAEMRAGLESFAEKHAGEPEADEARTLLAQVDAAYVTRAERELAAARSKAASLCVLGKYDEAAAAIHAVEERHGTGPWLASRGGALIQDALADIAAKRSEKARAALDRARVATEKRRFDTARAALSEHARWPEPQASDAKRLLARVDELAAQAEAERKTAEARRAFLLAALEAGAKSVPDLERFVEGARDTYRDAGLDDWLDRYESLVRAAKLVDSLALDSLKAARGRIRVHWGDRPVSGTLVELAGGVLKLRSVMGNVEDVPVKEIAPRDIVESAGLLGGDGRNAVKAAEYLYARGMLDEAASVAAELFGDRAERLRADIAATRRALAPPAVADETDDEPDEPAPGVAPAPTEGLVAHWTFDEGRGTTVADATGNGHSGVLNKLDPATAWAAGKHGTCLRVSGGGHVEVASSGKLTCPTYTVSAWVNIGSRSGTANIVGKYRSGSRTCHIAVTGDGRPTVNYNDGSWGDVTAATRLTDGEWHHVVATMAPPKAAVHVDGVMSASRDDLKQLKLNDAPLLIGSAGTYWHFDGSIDDVRVYDRALTLEEVVALFAAPVATRLARADATAPPADAPAPASGDAKGSPETDGYFLSPDVIARLAKRYAKDQVKEKNIAAFGGAAAASNSFDISLVEQLGRASGYAFTSKMGMARRHMKLADAVKNAERILGRLQPELVRICFDVGDLAKGKTAADLKGGLAQLIETIRSSGAVPVLFTLPMPAPRDAEALDLIEAYNKMVLALGVSENVPVLDAYRILNSDPANASRYFGRGSGLKKDGYAAVNTRFARLYRVLVGPPSRRWTINTDAKTKGIEWKGRGLRFYAKCTAPYLSGEDYVYAYWPIGTRPFELAVTVTVERGTNQVFFHPGVAVALTSERPFKMAKTDISVVWAVQMAGVAASVRRGETYGIHTGIARDKMLSRLIAPGGGAIHSKAWPKGHVSGLDLKLVIRRLDDGTVAFAAFNASGPEGLQKPWWEGSWKMPPDVAKVPLKYVSIKRIAVGNDHKGYSSFTMQGRITGLQAHQLDAAAQRIARGSVTPPEANTEPMPEPKPRIPPGPNPKRAPNGPASTPPAHRGSLPEGNLVRNGSFEERDEAAKFATYWRPHNWGPPASRHTSRVAASDAHDGDVSLVLKGFGGRAKPGVFTTMPLPPAVYEVSLWAVADAPEGAAVHVHLGGTDAPRQIVKGEWARFTFPVEITERLSNASLKLWTSTENVRVWIDDVQLVARAHARPKKK